MQPIFTPTPTPELAPAEIVESFTKATDAFNNLGVFMAVLLVITLFAIIILAIFWMNRNSTATALNLLTTNSAQKDKEIADLKAERDLKHQQHLEGLSAIHNQATRSNDLQEQSNRVSAQILHLMTAFNQRGEERDATERQFATNLDTLINTGSQPVRAILEHVQRIAGLVTKIDAQTADWQTIIQAVTPLLTELAALRLEAKKHDTGPIPKIETQTMPPANPIEASPL